MNAHERCQFLRHAVRLRHVGDLELIWCDCCGLLPAADRSLDTPLRPGAEPTGVPAIQRAGALAGCSPDGDLAGARRAIAQASPGRTFSSPDWAPGELVEAFGR